MRLMNNLLTASMSLKFCLPYDPLKWDFVVFKINIISIRKRIVVTVVVNDVTCTCEVVITRVVIQIFVTRRYPLNNSDATR